MRRALVAQCASERADDSRLGATFPKDVDDRVSLAWLVRVLRPLFVDVTFGMKTDPIAECAEAAKLPPGPPSFSKSFSKKMTFWPKFRPGFWQKTAYSLQFPCSCSNRP